MATKSNNMKQSKAKNNIDKQLRSFLGTREVRGIYKEVKKHKLQEQAVKMLQNAINKKRSEAIRSEESMVRRAS